jgi:hypothetical protein
MLPQGHMGAPFTIPLGICELEMIWRGFRRSIPRRNLVSKLSGGQGLIKRNSKEMWREVVLMPRYLR